MQPKIKRALFWFSVTIGFLAIVQQLKRPSSERNWHGSVLGVPYDFRPPNIGRMKNSWWDPDDRRIFTPRDFGVGWAVNIPRVLQLAHLQAEPERFEDEDEYA